MTLSAVHRPLNPPFRRAPVSNVSRDEVSGGFCRGVFGTFCGQKVQRTPQAKTAVVLLPLQAIKCGGLKPASAGDGGILREHANIGEHPLFACSRVRPVKNRGLHCDWQLRAAGLAMQARSLPPDHPEYLSITTFRPLMGADGFLIIAEQIST